MNTKMKTMTCLTAMSLIGASAHAATVALTDVTPVRPTAEEDPARPHGIDGTSDNGGSITNVVPSPSIAEPVTTYAMSITGLTIDGTAGVTVTFNLSLDANGSNTVNTSAGADWTVANNSFDNGESIVFTATDFAATGLGAGETAVFSNIDFTGADFTATGGSVAGTGTDTMTVSQGAGGNKIADIGLSFDVVIVPEPSSSLLSLAGAGLLLLRRRR